MIRIRNSDAIIKGQIIQGQIVAHRVNHIPRDKQCTFWNMMEVHRYNGFLCKKTIINLWYKLIDGWLMVNPNVILKISWYILFFLLVGHKNQSFCKYVLDSEIYSKIIFLNIISSLVCYYGQYWCWSHVYYF